MNLNKFVDKDIYDSCIPLSNSIELPALGIDRAIGLQLSRDIKELIKAIRELKIEVDGEDNA